MNIKHSLYRRYETNTQKFSTITDRVIYPRKEFHFVRLLLMVGFCFALSSGAGHSSFTGSKIFFFDQNIL